MLGITKDAILRLDQRTKEILKTWPLAQVKRWAATTNIFTIDFGEYQEGFYSVQTPDGDKISEVIAGYIDIIVKNRQQQQANGYDDGTEQEAVQDDGKAGGKNAIYYNMAEVSINLSKKLFSSVVKIQLYFENIICKSTLFYV